MTELEIVGLVTAGCASIGGGFLGAAKMIAGAVRENTLEIVGLRLDFARIEGQMEILTGERPAPRYATGADGPPRARTPRSNGGDVDREVTPIEGTYALHRRRER